MFLNYKQYTIKGFIGWEEFLGVAKESKIPQWELELVSCCTY